GPATRARARSPSSAMPAAPRPGRRACRRIRSHLWRRRRDTRAACASRSPTIGHQLGVSMSFFGKIFSKIFPSANAAEVVAAAPAPAAATAAAPPAPIPLGDVAPILDAMPGAAGLNWRTSIVDLLKLL